MPVETNMYAQQPSVKLDPAGAVTTANAMLQNRLMQGVIPQHINNSQLENAQKKLGFISSQISPLISMGDKVSQADIARTVTHAVTNSGGAITPEEGSKFYTQIVSNPGGIPTALKQFHTSILGGLEQIQVFKGAQGTVDNGNSVQSTRTDLYTGRVDLGQGSASNVRRQLGPAERANPMTTYQNGQSGTVPVGTVFDDYGNPRGNALTGPAPLPPMAPTAGAGAASNMAPRNMTMAPDPIGGRKGAPGTTGPGQAAGDPRAVPVAQGAPSYFNPTSANAASAGSVDLLNRDRTLASNYRADVTPLETAIPLLEKLGPTGTGPASEKLNDLRSLAITLGVPGAGAWTDNVKAYDETRKYLLQSAMKGDVGTNDKLASAIAGNPSVRISNAAATDVAKASLALRRMQHAGYLQNQVAGQEGSYADRAAQWNSKQDPRAFAVDLMSPTAKAALVKSLGKPGDPAYQRFQRSLEAAHEAGVFGSGAR
jgi:hypothetical protein